MNFLSRVNNYIEDMATFTASVKIYSTEYFYNTKVAGLGDFFVQRIFPAIRHSELQIASMSILFTRNYRVGCFYKSRFLYSQLLAFESVVREMESNEFLGQLTT